MWILGIIFYSVVWAVVCSKVAENKGYERGNWHIWGFFFGIFAFLVLVTKQPKSKTVTVEPESALSRMVREDEELKEKRAIASGTMWKCPKCKKANSNYIRTCSCGTEKPDPIIERTSTPKWTCVNCGAQNTIYQVICKCGMKKSENDQRTAAGEVYKNTQQASESENIDILKKYKELLDMGAISQEEFQIKKKELL